MRLAILALLLVGCGDNLSPEPGPDAGVVALDVAIDAAPDATVDATPDADTCYTHRLFTCASAGTITDVCVPAHGCVYETCDGMQYGFCGPN